MYKTGAEDGEMSKEEKLCCQNNKRKEEIRRPRGLGLLFSGIYKKKKKEKKKIMIKKDEHFGLGWSNKQAKRSVW